MDIRSVLTHSFTRSRLGSQRGKEVCVRVCERESANWMIERWEFCDFWRVLFGFVWGWPHRTWWGIYYLFFFFVHSLEFSLTLLIDCVISLLIQNRVYKIVKLSTFSLCVVKCICLLFLWWYYATQIPDIFQECKKVRKQVHILLSIRE